MYQIKTVKFVMINIEDNEKNKIFDLLLKKYLIESNSIEKYILLYFVS